MCALYSQTSACTIHLKLCSSCTDHVNLHAYWTAASNTFTQVDFIYLAPVTKVISWLFQSGQVYSKLFNQEWHVGLHHVTDTWHGNASILLIHWFIDWLIDRTGLLVFAANIRELLGGSTICHCFKENGVNRDDRHLSTWVLAICSLIWAGYHFSKISTPVSIAWL